MQNRFKILFIASKRNIGLSYYYTQLGITLKNVGNKIILVSSNKQEEPNLFDKIKKAKIPHYKLSSLDTLKIKTLIVEAKKLGKILDTEKIDIIHGNGIHHLIYAFLASKIFSNRRKPKKIIVTLHSYLHGTPLEKLTLLIESILINLLADKAIPVSKSFTKKLIHYGVNPKKIQTIYNGVTLKTFQNINNFILPIKPSSSLLIAYSATHEPRKGHIYLIQAFSIVLKEFPNAKLVLTGKGPLTKNLKHLAKKLKIEKNIIFTGQIPYKDLYNLLHNINIFVFPSLAEICPIAVLEAMAAGKPIVATNVGGIPEIVKQNINGILVQPKNPEKLASAIIEIAKNPKKAEIMGQKSRKIVEENFNLTKIVENITNCYRKIKKDF